VVGERGVYGESIFSRIRRAIVECEVVRGQENGRWSWEKKGEGRDKGIGTVGRVSGTVLGG